MTPHDTAARPGRAASSGCPSLALTVGNTPLAFVSGPIVPEGRGFWAKLEGFNPGGIKDRPALHMIRQARARGDLVPGGTVVESTSGTFGLGLALAGIVFGHPVVLVGDPGLEPLMRRLLTSYGVRLEIVTEPDPVGGWQEARRRRVRRLTEELPGSYCPDQYNNPDSVTAYAGLAHELMGRLPQIDVLVCSVGTGGHSAGIHRVLRQHHPGVKLVGVDTVGSTIFGQPARPRLMRGLGSSIHPRNVAYDSFDEVHWVSAAEAVWACRALAARHYVSGGWSTGAVTLVARWLARTGPADRTIVAIFPDGPWRYWNTIFADDYCLANGLLATVPAEEPDEVASLTEREVRRWTRCADVADPADVRARGRRR
ncbi:PLP-dependent cysteine synthase family protein [Streptosporangium carneum]|uniref:Pyridoxal phosphate-dependent protein CysK2 n=1 Tax=Streptosporangium carneum TaxID=47481 RepID=A0A9W6I580_9ACTN|nr:PLP-dependent cysteine synthase family protein [Streptosporangium carneum]GLK12256.1 putative pyridoxal phosphate-dependent protein CysK2 [Streptosporangium carneum]